MPTDKMMGESAKMARMPDRAPEVMAQKGGGTKSKQMAMPSTSGGQHMPMVAPSHMAAKGMHVDGMAKMAKMQEEMRKPVMAPNVMASAGRNTNRGA